MTATWPKALTTTRDSVTGVVTVLMCLLLVALTMAPASADHATRDPDQRILVIGGLLNGDAQTAATLQPMADYVKLHMADYGVEDVVTIGVQNRQQLVQLVRHGRVDWISQAADNLIYFMRFARMDVLARGWRDGSPTLSSVFVVRADSRLNTLNDLHNHVIALEQPYSASPYSVPILELQSRGETFMLASPWGRAPENQIAYLVSRSDYNTALWVHKGIVDAGVLSRTHWNNRDIVSANFRKNLRVIHETEEFVTALELVRSDLDADLKQGLGRLLQKMHKDTDAAPLLRAYYNTQRFDEPTATDLKRLELLSAKTASPQHAAVVGP